MEPQKQTFGERWKAFTGRIFRFDIRPHKQWGRLIAKTLILAVILVALHAYLYHRIQTGAYFAVVPVQTTPVPSVNAKKLESVMDQENGKTTARAAAATLVPAVADPSK